MFRIPVVLLISLICTQAGAQCLSRQVMWHILEGKTFDLSDPKLLPYLYSLKKSCNECGYQKDSLEAKVNEEIGQAYFGILSLDSARLYFHNAIQINSAGTTKTNAAHNLRNYFYLGLAERGLLYKQGAISAFGKCIELAKNDPDKTRFLLESYRNIAEVYYHYRDLKECLQKAEFGELESQKAGSDESRAVFVLIQAEARYTQGEIKEADALINRARQIALGMADPSAAGKIFVRIANIRNEQHLYSEAISSYVKAIHLLDPLSTDKKTYTKACHDLGNLFLWKQKDYKKAFSYFRRSFDYTPETREKAEIARKLGLVCLRTNEKRKALEYYQVALSLLVPSFRPENLTGNPALSDSRRIADKPELFTYLTEKGHIWLDSARATDRNSPARQNISGLALGTYLLADSLTNYMLWQRYDDVPGLIWHQLTAPLYQNALEACFISNRADQALHFFEKSKFIKLKDRVGDPKSMLNPKDRSQYERLNKEIERHRSLLEDNKTRDRDLTGFHAALSRLLEAREEFIHERMAANPFYTHYRDEKPFLTSTRLRQKTLQPLGEPVAYLTYLIGDKSLYGLLVSLDAVRFRKISLQEYQKLMPQFSEILARKETYLYDEAEFLKVSNKLYRLLFEPFGIVTERRIIVSPAEHIIPFEALSRSAQKPEYLIRKHAFSYTYSSIFLNNSAADRNAFPFHKNFMGMAPVQFDTRLGQSSLPASSEALKSVSESFLLPKIYTGAAASADRFIAEAPDYRVLQFYTHAFSDGNTTRLYFADSALTLTAFSEKRFRAQLIVLPHCTAKTKQEGAVFNFTSGFTLLGIASVVTPLWNVAGEAAYDQMRSFYEHLAQGTPLDVALQNTKLKWLDSASLSNQNPGQWASLVLIGDVSPISTNKEIYWGLLLGLTIFALTLYTTFVYQKKRRRREIAENQDS